MRRTYLLAFVAWLAVGTVPAAAQGQAEGWGERAPLLAPRAGVASVAANGCLYLIGGEGNDADPRGVFDRNEVYDPATDSWRSLAALPLATHGLTGAAFLNGWIHVPGGASARGVSGANVTFAHQVYRTDLACGPAGG